MPVLTFRCLSELFTPEVQVCFLPISYEPRFLGVIRRKFLGLSG
jgi:hypothetical protein